MWLVYIISGHKFGFEEMDKLIHEGGILFVCCAVMKIINADCFKIPSLTSVYIIGFSAGYCILNKTILLIKEDKQYE